MTKTPKTGRQVELVPREHAQDRERRASRCRSRRRVRTPSRDAARRRTEHRTRPPRRARPAPSPCAPSPGRAPASRRRQREGEHRRRRHRRAGRHGSASCKELRARRVRDRDHPREAPRSAPGAPPPPTRARRFGLDGRASAPVQHRPASTGGRDRASSSPRAIPSADERRERARGPPASPSAVAASGSCHSFDACVASNAATKRRARRTAPATARTGRASQPLNAPLTAAPARRP